MLSKLQKIWNVTRHILAARSLSELVATTGTVKTIGGGTVMGGGVSLWAYLAELPVPVIATLGIVVFAAIIWIVVGLKRFVSQEVVSAKETPQTELELIGEQQLASIREYIRPILIDVDMFLNELGKQQRSYLNVTIVFLSQLVFPLDKGQKVRFWDIIDNKTRFLLASHMSETRMTKDAEALMRQAYDRTGKIPRVIYTDRLRAYLDGIELTFGANTKHRQGGPFDIENNTNLIERFHGTLKARTKVMRGMQNKDTARLIMDGWLIHYNYFRPHEALGNKTPAEVAKANFPYKGWKDVVMGGVLK